MTHVNLLELITVTVPQAEAPILTVVVPLTKPVPETVNTSAPAVVPESGKTETTDNGAEFTVRVTGVALILLKLAPIEDVPAEIPVARPRVT